MAIKSVMFYSLLLLSAMCIIDMAASDNDGNKPCTHADGLDKGIKPRTQGCEECKREGTHWVALRLCLECGHVGCCDSSIGLHGTKHYRETGHPAIMALPDKPWKWCYADKAYA